MFRALRRSVAFGIVVFVGGGSAIAQGTGPAPVSRAGDFVDSIGVDTHFNYPGTPYTEENVTIVEALLNSGIHHIRDGGLRYSRQRTLTYLGERGITHSLGFPAETTAAEIRAGLRANAPYVDYVEPQNELDLNHKHPNWASEWRNEQQLLYTTVRGDPANAGITVVGPALGHFRDASELGALDQFEDVGSMHHYPCAFNPGETQSKVSLAAVMEKVRLVHQSKPIWTTEIGYEDDLPAGKCALPDSVIAKYDPRTLAERWLAGQPRTYFYQFSDMGNVTGYDSMGLVSTSGAPKPQYVALQSLLKVLGDSSRAFTPRPLAYSLGGNTANVHQLLLQKHDGTYDLLLWLEVAGWNAATQAQIDVPVQHVRVALPSAPVAATLFSYASNWELQSHRMAPANTIDVPVGDAIAVLEFHS